MILSSGIVGGYAAKAVTYDGTNDYLTRGSELTGNADGKLGLLSFWVKGAALPASPFNSYLFYNASVRFRVRFDTTTDNLQILGSNTSGTVILSMSTSVATLDDAWHHILAAWDMTDSAKCKIYQDGVDRTTLTTRTDENIDYTFGGWQVGATNTGATKLNGDVAEVWFSNSEWADITDSAVRGKFAKAGRPVSLGADGSRPTGTAPIIYLKGPASAWGTNYGTGGDFSVTGSFTDAATKPSY